MVIKSKNTRFIIEDQQNDFVYQKSKSNLNISFNRISFIFFVFFIITIIYSIHSLHLGSRKSKNIEINYLNLETNNLYRADITDREGNYLAKTISSIDVGISPSKIIDVKKLIINLKFIFPDKNYENVKNKIKKGRFFYFEKKVSQENYEKSNLGIM